MRLIKLNPETYGDGDIYVMASRVLYLRGNKRSGTTTVYLDGGQHVIVSESVEGVQNKIELSLAEHSEVFGEGKI